MEVAVRVTAVCCLVTSGAVVVAPADRVAAEPATWVVDDDRQQCPEATHESITSAVNDEALDAGDLIRVCPGLYRESVTINKPLTLKGDPDAVEAVDCFATGLAEPDPAEQVIVDGGGSEALALFTLAADDITLAGFVLQRAANPPPLPADANLLRRAVDVSGAYSGSRIHHNLFRLNTIGIQFGSSGARWSRLDHNCLRQNAWGLVSDHRDLINARIDHNATFDTTNFAFELFGFDNARENITFDHNVSRQDNTAYLIAGSKSSALVANTVESAQIGMRIEPANEDLEISHNLITDPFGTNRVGFVLQGIAFPTPGVGVAPTKRALVRGNQITGMGIPGSTSAAGDGIVVAGPPNTDRPAVMESTFTDNVTSDNLRDGIVLRGGNAGNTLRGNISERNGRFGILVQGAVDNVVESNIAGNNGADGIALQRATRGGVNYDATDNHFHANSAHGNRRDGIFADRFTARNTFLANQMLGNTRFDAHDDSVLLGTLQNLWIANQCGTASPDGLCATG
jgi:parallel beta-helix repeat protein